MKKILKLLFTLTAVAILGAILAISAFAEIYTGECGENVTYKLDTETGLLEISGTGNMHEYWTGNSPWYSNNSHVKTVIISDGVTSIGGDAFYRCYNLTSVTIKNSVTSIGGYAFQYCYALTSVTIPDSVTSIGHGAFRDCSSLTSINIPDSVTSVGYGTFACCSSLTSVTIPNSVTSIGDYAFAWCSSLESIVFKAKNATINESAFDYCHSLKTIYCYTNSTADQYFSGDQYTKIYLDDIKFGDARGDLIVNSKDMMLLVKALVGLDIEIDKTAADCNLDGVFDIKDLVLLAQYLSGWNVTLG